MRKKFFCTAFLITLFAVGIFAQTPTPTPTADLETILTEADKQTDFYQQTFKDLLATETKTFEKFDKNGELKDETAVESIFLVYQSVKDANKTVELRNVVKVDNKLVPDSQTRADKFLSELQKASTAEKELEKIEKESLRYDKTLRIIGFTLNQAIALSANLRPIFDFKLLGTENIQGNEVYVVSYQQTKKSPFILINKNAGDINEAYTEYDIDIPGALKKNDVFLRGKLWIDARTFQLWREERQLAIQTSEPLVAIETVLEYSPSEYEILVPQKITFTENKIKKISKTDDYGAAKNLQAAFDYSKFRKTNVEVNIIDEP